MIRPLILLDLDGTLVDSFADIAAGVTAACLAAGLPAAPATLALTRRGLSLEDIYAVARGDRDDVLPFERFAAAYREHYLPNCLATTVPYPGVRETLAELRELSPRPFIAVATTKRAETAGRILDGTGLRALIDGVVGSDGLPPKPDPAILRAAAALGGHDARLALMVGDTDRDILAARAAGCACAAVTYGGLSADELRPFSPDYLLGAFAEVLAVLT